ncbi:MAG: cation transporting ATPase C-terminal domain-containing protein, partial [Planctomycetales bacterium]|nr:cation transporting ATPase C-terminal domain-containing protein [Planctomycetales bacterium]
AHIGVAMGITGTDVSKEASQMVLLDDNFATIVNAVEQGRIVYDNIRKFVRYTLTSNSGEVWVMVLGPLLGMPLPLLPLQILWINLVTDGLPGLALAFENAERNTMRRPPFPQQQHILSGGLGRDIVWIGFLMGLCSLAMGYWDWKTGHSQASHWRTMIFTTLTLSQMGYVMALRSQRDSLFTIGVFSNPLLVLSVGVTFALQMAVIYLPALQGIFHTTALTAAELGGCIVLSGAVFWIVEGQKFLARRLRRDSRRVPQGN